MRLLSSDLFRNFGIGFVAGAVLGAGVHAQSGQGDLIAPAQAAQSRPTSAPAATSDLAAEFVIAPEPR